MDSGCTNPIIFFDELDKIAERRVGLVSRPVHLTDPEGRDTITTNSSAKSIWLGQHWCLRSTTKRASTRATQSFAGGAHDGLQRRTDA